MHDHSAGPCGRVGLAKNPATNAVVREYNVTVSGGP